VAQSPEVDVLFVGEVFCDLVFGGTPDLPVPGGEVHAERFQVSAGGTATRCIASARLGLSTGLAGTIGLDMFGAHVAAELSSVSHLDLRWLRRVPAVQTPITVAIANHRGRTFITYEEEEARYPEQWDGELPHTRVLHVGMGRPLPDWVTRLRAGGTLVVGGVGWDPTGDWSCDLLGRLAEVDVFLPNAVEAMSYTRTRTVEAAAVALAGLVPQVVVSDGAAGSVGVDEVTGKVIRVPAPRVQVADPTGAGDVFTAAFIYGLLAGWPLQTRMRFACLCASWSVRTLGGAGSAPTWSDIRTFLDAGSDTSERDYELIGAAIARTTLRERA
jgi:sugar/nucleoside kinase (ribokinase family)